MYLLRGLHRASVPRSVPLCGRVSKKMLTTGEGASATVAGSTGSVMCSPCFVALLAVCATLLFYAVKRRWEAHWEGERLAAEAGAAMYARISSTRGELGPIVRFAGGLQAEWAGSMFHAMRFAVLPMLTTQEGNTLRLVCRELKHRVEEHPWEDMETVIQGYMGARVGEREGQRGAWRACFPQARGANVGGRGGSGHDDCGRPTPIIGRHLPMRDADFVHFVGLRALNMSYCKRVTDAAFVHLQGIEKLDMSHCNQDTITDAAFTNLRGIHTLNMSDCNQPTITNAAFAYLAGIHTLNISQTWRWDPGYPKLNITDAAFINLAGIHTLDMSWCDQATITDAAFGNLRGIHTLKMSGCDQPTITDAAFANLRGIHTLDMSACNQPAITDAAFSNLAGIHTLNMSYCRQRTITDAAFANLRGIHTLGMSGCKQRTITGAAFANLRDIHTLDMSYCNQPTITDSALVHLRGIHTLKIYYCRESLKIAARATRAACFLEFSD